MKSAVCILNSWSISGSWVALVDRNKILFARCLCRVAENRWESVVLFASSFVRLILRPDLCAKDVWDKFICNSPCFWRGGRKGRRGREEDKKPTAACADWSSAKNPKWKNIYHLYEDASEDGISSTLRQSQKEEEGGGKMEEGEADMRS